MTFGARVVSSTTPDKNGKFADVVLGFDKLDGYLKDNTPTSASNAGRCGNRIAGEFTLDGKEYTLASTTAPTTLHGGKEGFDKKHWRAKRSPARSGVHLHRAPTARRATPASCR